jgi:hypothetical protein
LHNGYRAHTQTGQATTPAAGAAVPLFAGAATATACEQRRHAGNWDERDVPNLARLPED